jgi:hypothetical protein
MYKILVVNALSVNPFHVAIFLKEDNYEARKPPTISYMWAIPPMLKRCRALDKKG